MLRLRYQANVCICMLQGYVPRPGESQILVGFYRAAHSRSILSVAAVNAEVSARTQNVIICQSLARILPTSPVRTHGSPLLGPHNHNHSKTTRMMQERLVDPRTKHMDSATASDREPQWIEMAGRCMNDVVLSLYGCGDVADYITCHNCMSWSAPTSPSRFPTSSQPVSYWAYGPTATVIVLDRRPSPMPT
jgi:hypothetical protein